MIAPRIGRLTFVRIIALFLILMTALPASSSFMPIPALKADTWAGWDIINTIYYNPTQEDANNQYLYTAAQEIKTYLMQMSGRSWTVVTNSPPAPPAVYLSVNATMLGSHGIEAFRLVIDNNGVTITGKTAIAARWGAYYLLDEKLGVRWFFKNPAWTVVPNSLSNPGALDVIVEPDFYWRFIDATSYVGITAYADWVMHNKLYGAKNYLIYHSYGDILNEAVGWYAMTDQQKQNYYNAHPNNFLPNNRYPNYPWQLNPESADVINMSIQYAREKFGTMVNSPPGWQYNDDLWTGVVPITPNDGGGDGFDPPYNWQDIQTITDKVFGLANAVAANVSSEYPGKYVGVCDYAPYSGVPSIALEPNILAVLTSAFNFSNLSNYQRLAGLKAKGVKLGWYEYVDVWDWWHDGNTLTDDILGTIKWLKDEGVAYYDGESTDGWGAKGLTYYILSKLLWDADLNVDEIKADFYTKAFGPAATVMQKYYEIRDKDNISLAQSFNYLSQAETLAAGNSAVLTRIRQLEYYNRFVWKWHYVGINHLSLADLESFYTFVCKTRDTYVDNYYEAEIDLRAELINNRGLTTAQVNALQDFTAPTTGQIATWLSEAMSAFSSFLTSPEYINFRHIDLEALGDTTTPAVTPLYGNTRDILIYSSGSENVTVRAKTAYQFSMDFYSPCGILLGSWDYTNGADTWVSHNFTTEEAGYYIIHVNRIVTGRPQSQYITVDVLDKPAAVIADERSAIVRYEQDNRQYTAPQFTGTNSQYFYVPAGTSNFTFGVTVIYSGNPVVGSLIDSDNVSHNFNWTSNSEMTLTNPPVGLWKLSINNNPTLNYFWFRGIPPLVWHDPEYLMVPAAGTAAPPVLNPIGDKVVSIGQLLQFTVSATDPNNDPLTYSASNLPPWATFTPATRIFSGTANQTGTYSNIRFTVSDGALTDSENITIIAGNVPPVLAGIGNKSTHAGWPLQFTVSATDPNGDNLTYSASNLPPWATFTPDTRTFAGTANQTGTYTNVHFEVSDLSLTDSENITITVTANQAPVLTNPGNKSVDEGAALTFIVSATDPDSDPLTYSANNMPSGATFTPATRTFSWTPSYSQAGTYANVRFNVTDSALSDSENITITINNVNRAPVLSPIVNKSVTEGQLLTFTVSATDLDGDNLTYSANNTPSGASFNGTSRTFTWTPASSQVGSYPNVRFAVIDGALTASETITITVAAIPSSPPSGGVGGGGGGGGGAAGVTSLRGSTTTTGLMIEDVSATDINLKVELRIPKGATVLNRSGQPLTSIRIIPKAESQAASSGSGIISQSYEIAPSGTTFNESATLIFRYSSSELPPDIPASNLYIALLDPEAMTWTDLGGTVDANTRTVSVPITHLSTYALMAHNRPADLTVTRFAFSQPEVAPGEAIQARIEINNQGDLNGTYEANLKLDNAAVQTRTVNLNGSSSETIVFTMTSDTIGEHKATLGDMVATFIVKKLLSPASFAVSELSINPIIADSGKNVEVSANVKNAGDLAGTYRTTLSIDDVAMETKEISLDGGGSTTISFSFTPSTAGQHKVSIGGLLAPFEVKSPPPLLPPPATTKVSKLELNSFSTTPNYDKTTNTLVYVRIAYQMNQSWKSFPDARLMLMVFDDGQFLEQVPLFSLSELQADGQSGELAYLPPAGWESGKYAFGAELYLGESLVQDTPLRKVTVTPEATTTVVSWKTPDIIVGAALALGSLILILALYYRRDMRRDYWK